MNPTDRTEVELRALTEALRESTEMLALLAPNGARNEARKIVLRRLRANRRLLEKGSPLTAPAGQSR